MPVPEFVRPIVASSHHLLQQRLESIVQTTAVQWGIDQRIAPQTLPPTTPCPQTVRKQDSKSVGPAVRRA